MDFPGLVIHSDGSFIRTGEGSFPHVPSRAEFVHGVATADITIDSVLPVRIFLPDCTLQPAEKLPVIVYFHGGGFLLLSARSAPLHSLCERLATKLKTIVISVDYRLAPEHRLPAAYEDGARTLAWLEALAAGGPTETTPWPWVEAYGDLSKVIVMGDSAGGNIAHHTVVGWSNQEQPKVMKVAAEVLIMPFFGREARSISEERHRDGPVITVKTSDICWQYALPEGVNRDHHFSNQAAEAAVDRRRRYVSDSSKTMVAVGGKDPLRDRAVELVEMLELEGRTAKLVEYETAAHGFYIVPESSEGTAFMDELAAFLRQC